MRRPSVEAVDDLKDLVAILLAFRQKGNGSRLPIYSDVFLAYLASQPDGAATMQALREWLTLGPSTTSRTCAALERAGLVHIGPAPEDHRRSLVRVTAKGHRIIDDALSALRGRRR